MIDYNLRIFVLSLLILNSLCLRGQVNHKLFNKAISEKKFASEFAVCDLDSILLYDKIGLINFQDSSFICGNKIIVVRDSIYDIQSGIYSPYKVSSLIIFAYAIAEGNKITLLFWRPYSGATLRLTYKIRKEKYKLIQEEWGAF